MTDRREFDQRIEPEPLRASATTGRGPVTTSADIGTRPDGPETREVALSCSDLVLDYDSDDDPIIDGETLQVPEGEVTALVGPNGSGKSTLLRGFARELRPTEGTVLADGQNIQSYSTKELARELGLLSQQNVAPDSLTVNDLVTHGRYPHRSFFGSLDRDDSRAVEWAIEKAGIEHLRDRAVGSLSGGQTQLAWIAMLLAQQPSVILLDEPTTYLDLHNQFRVLDLVETLCDETGMTVFIVLHDIAQASRVADWLVAVRDGRVYDRGPPAAVVSEAMMRDVFQVEADVEFDSSGPSIRPLGHIERDEHAEEDA